MKKLVLILGLVLGAGVAHAQTPAPAAPVAEKPVATPTVTQPVPYLPWVSTKTCPAAPDPDKAPDWIKKLDQSCWDTEGENFWFPVAASKAAHASDFMFYVVLGLSIFCFVGITGCIVYFVVKYRHRPGHTKPLPSSSHNDAMEITWSVIPSIICVFLFIGGWNGYIDMETRPADPMTIKVTAKKWHWTYEYPDGTQLDNLVLPKDQPVELQMTSVDVLHSFYVPAFRTKQDVVPKRYTYVYITPTREGVYRMYCAEYCGREHSLMKVRAIVLDAEVFKRYMADWNAAVNQMTPQERGKNVYETKGCKSCHSIDGSKIVGPTWKGSWGTDVPLADGSTRKMDAAYVKQSIMEPASQIHQGYSNAMPSFAGQLTEEDVTGVAAYIESLK